MDIEVRVAPGLTLTTTIDPDFGQVEADPAVVNLSALQTFFSERRPYSWKGPASSASTSTATTAAAAAYFIRA